MGSSLLPKMKLTLLLFLIPLALAQPQNFRENIRNIVRNNPQIRDRIKDRVSNSELHPCQGERPTSCSCTNGQAFTPGSNVNSDTLKRPCGDNARVDVCTCPSGITFKPEDVVDNVAGEHGIPNCGKGVSRPDVCTCRDGSTFTLPPTSIPPCGGRRQMESCTCPNGNTISSSQIRNAIIPLLQG